MRNAALDMVCRLLSEGICHERITCEGQPDSRNRQGHRLDKVSGSGKDARAAVAKDTGGMWFLNLVPVTVERSAC